MESNQQLYKWIGKRIASFREEKKLSQTDLAQLTDLSRGSIANIEKGRQQTPLHVLWDIAKNLNISINRIIPIHNEHIPESTDKLPNDVEQLKEFDEEHKKILNQFFSKKL